ncbi:protocadherin-23 [Cuculus canorus]|uniref:protocadherin-23 n=1 Tax=Cuculus canorus TaxID=55661 RepID=UPI0023AABD92|nr:protocadherin-23 [Cuculus canorus]
MQKNEEGGRTLTRFPSRSNSCPCRGVPPHPEAAPAPATAPLRHHLRRGIDFSGDLPGSRVVLRLHGGRRGGGCGVEPPPRPALPSQHRGAGRLSSCPRCRLSMSRRGGRCRGGVAPAGRALALLLPLWLSAAGGAAPAYHLRLAVDEGLPAETLVGDIRAGLPAGAGPPGGFLLSEESGDSAVLADFHVQPETGIIRTARPLDRESRARYSFAAATLRGEVVQVEIAVTDVNDHPPRFPREHLQLDVSELSPPGTAFRLPAARDPDAGRFGTQGYALREEGGAAGEPPLFQLRYGRLEPLELVLLRRLDRERAEAHRLLVEAWDGGVPRRRGRLRVRVRVLDENDNAPAFSRGEYQARLREDAPPGTAVCRLRATDPDLGANGEVRYALGRRQSDPGGYFAVEERSGVLRLRRPLDREARALHRLVVEARDGGAPPEVSSALVSVAVLDVNDNRPAIRLLFLTDGPRVSEAARPGDYVARVSVSDADEGAAGGAALALLGGDGAFALRPAGSGVFFLCVAGPLDRESRDLYELRLVATDGGAPPLSAEEPLLLRVADVNDEAPRFPQPRYSASVSEAASPGTAVLRLSASDADEPGSPNAEVRYALEGDPAALALLRIDARSGAVSTRARLDRERHEALELRVVARDGGRPPRAAACSLTVRLEDANDNEPRFERQVYRGAVPEHAAAGSCPLQVKATDADADQFGEIEYFLYDGFHYYEKSKAFQIDPRTGQICVSQDIDREGDPTTYDLLVKATDGGGLSAQAFVRIEIEDINDNQPVFEQAVYVTSISSHTHPGTEIINVVATDKDSGIYGVVIYELVPGEFSSLFTVDTSTGIIYLISALGHLASSVLFLTVSARDGGGLPSATNAAVTVNILQTPSAPAVFERSRYAFSVPEDAPEGCLIGTVKARGPPNSLEVVSYRISSGDPHGRFSIDPQFGIIRTKNQLDHETQSVVVLTIQSQLGNSPVYSSTQVNISVIDVNDNPPVFLTKSDKVTISHTQPPGTAIYIAHAEDKDSGLNGEIKYSITSKQSNAFSIDPSRGVVNLTRTLFADEQQEYILHIAAEDCGNPPLTSLLMLTVIIEEQKMGPTLVFQNLMYQVEISEATSPGAQILQVQAHSLNLHSVSSKLIYSLEPNTDSVSFGISSDSGWIYLRRHLNYECAQILSFRAVVSTSEDENPSPNASTSVIINVLDENDNSPMFMCESYFFEVEEDPLPKGVIGTITAVDKDSGRNGQLSYFLLSEGKYFKMNSNTGEIINWVALDREKQAHHHLTVLVTDHGSPQLNATTNVYIAVRDLNDNKPLFPQAAPGQEMHFKVLEGQPSGTLIATVFAKDFDSGNNGVVQYSIEPEEDIKYFQIDAVSGELRTTWSLSHAERSDYRVVVTARDQGTPSLQGHAAVYIQVIPLPRGTSIFSQDFKHFVVPENFKPAQALNSLKWPENHLTTNRKLHFSIVEDDDDDDVHFEIDSLTGDLFLSKGLDYETTSHFLLQVIIKDYNNKPPENSTIFLSIDVEDQNDHAPYFQDDFVVIGVEENVPVGTVVYTFNAKDGDGSFLNSKIQYSLEMSNMGENPFHVHPSCGALTTAFPLDREITRFVILTVSASDQAINLTDRRRDSLAVKVVILDINDNSPSFTSLPLSYVMEDVEVGFLVHHITAKDPDEGRNGQVTYHILSGNENKAFVLDKITGLLTTAQLLDREIQERYSLTVMACDDGSPALSATQVLTIVVVDVNDETPVFLKQLYETAVCENQDPGEVVIKVEAVDRDAGLNSLLQYEILPGTGYEKFKINSDSGELITTASLDRETQEIFSIKVLVRDSGTPSLSSTVTVICKVLDENDHSPTFLLPASEIRIPENQQPSVVYVTRAVDMDAGNNGALRYKIIGGNVGGYFTLNNTSGKLLVTRSLDREDVSNFTLVIECHDLGIPSRSSTAQLYLMVLDENDHNPLFAKTQYQISVREDLEEGSAILDLFASDEDDGPNGEVTYALIDDTFGAFAVDSVTGSIVTTKALDRETKSQYTFRAVASDCSTDLPRSTTVSVVVHVDDVNDSDPVFLQNPIRAFVPAETAVNETIATVRAEDMDLGSNGAVVFSLMPAETVFQIDPKTGDITLQEPLASKDFSTQLLVTASDQGISPRTATAIVVIFTEEQEEEISFSRSLYEASLPENSVTGTSVLTVEAYENTFTGENIKYSIFSDKESIFSIHHSTGVITVKEPKFLDYEVRNKIHLSVLAENSLKSVLCGVTVLIQDMNDNVPKFEQRCYKASVWEGQTKTDIIQIFATDLDSGMNGEIEYLIISGNENSTFLIDSTRGILATNAVLDHESSSYYRLVVQAADKGNQRLSSTSIVQIQVLDVNDNAPVVQPPGEVEVPENALPGFTVTQVSASDADSRPALQFGFIYDNSHGMKFAIDQHTGVVTVVEPLDFEETAVYKLRIIVSDSVHQTEAELTILVLDINDNPPVFTQDLYQVRLPELISMDAALLTVSAVDRDSEHNGMISYKILSSPQGFSIDHKNGAVFATRPVTQLEKISIIRLLIEATDGGSPALSAVTSVEVHVEDVNNYAPQFTRILYNLSVSEDASVGESILTFSAIDYDWAHDNMYVEYSIIDGNAENLFSVETRIIESETSYKLVGSLLLNNVLDREKTTSHHLVLLASDRGTPSLNSTATVLITVLDVNDNPPVFISSEYHIHVKESISVGSHITEVSSNDCDAGANAEITYAIISGNDRGHFHVDEKMGSVDLMKTLDYEDTMKFTLIIQATDGGAYIKNVAFSVVLVSVLDDNDYAPLFVFPSLSCVVSENLPTFSSVCTVNALDFDKGSYGYLTYSIQSSCLAHREAPRDHDMFFIDPLTGDIHTKQMFDYESQNKYCLIIQAKDKGDSQATITVQVDIEGRDEFDPVFTQDKYFFNLPEKNEAGQLLGRVTASDNDGGLDGVVHYSLLETSPFFSVNQTSGNIYLTQTVHRNKSGSKRNDDTLELLVRAHSPKTESKFTVCTVLVNVSNSPESYPSVSAYSLTISISTSLIVSLLLVVSLIVFILRCRRKDLVNSCVKKEAVCSSVSDMNLASIDKDCQKIQSTESNMLPMGAIAEWLSQAGVREGKDDGVPCRHSDSSGHGSAEGETAEDEEIKRINENPCRKSTGSILSERSSRVPDSGIPRESDQLSCQSGEMDVTLSMESVQANEGGEEACVHKMLPQTLQKTGIKEKDIMADLTRECVLMSGGQDCGYDTLATLSTSDEDLTGGYNWDCVVSWEPRFQCLASVFNDIAKLKDENVHIHSFPKEKKSLVFPPPLITSVAQPGIRTVLPRKPNIILGQAFKEHPRSPLIHSIGYPPPTMTPSFSPSLSLLTIQTPTASPVMSDGKMIGTCLIEPSHELVTEEELQV